jgi:hypothetical protein
MARMLTALEMRAMLADRSAARAAAALEQWLRDAARTITPPEQP